MTHVSDPSDPPDPEKKKKTAEEALSEELGMDVEFVEQQLRFRLDLSRMQRGEVGELGYVLIDRQNNPDAAVAFDTKTDAESALDAHELIDSLCAEDCLDAYVSDQVLLADLAAREIILP